MKEHSPVSCCADYTRMLLRIKDEEGPQMLQMIYISILLHIVSVSADRNNMKFQDQQVRISAI